MKIYMVSLLHRATIKKVKYPRLQIKSNFVKQSRYIIITDGMIQFITIILYCLLLN